MKAFALMLAAALAIAGCGSAYKPALRRGPTPPRSGCQRSRPTLGTLEPTRIQRRECPMFVRTTLAATLLALAGCASISTPVPEAPPARLAEARTAAEHEAAAAWYERQAAAAGARVAAHERMLRFYASPYPDYASPGIVGHCLGLIERYGQAAGAHRALAASHRLAAAQAE